MFHMYIYHEYHSLIETKLHIVLTKCVYSYVKVVEYAREYIHAKEFRAIVHQFGLNKKINKMIIISPKIERSTQMIDTIFPLS